MSEFQYYEFIAIDRPLSAAAQRRLRGITSRATISSTHLVNTYEWGNFKGDPFELVSKYFDAFCYYANWGTRQLMLRVPAARLDWAAVGRYCVTRKRRGRTSGVASATVVGRYVVFDFVSENDSGADWGEEPPTSLAALAPLREEFMRGDLRALYSAWRLRVQAGEVGGQHRAPPKPPGLARPTGAQQALSEFLRLGRIDAGT